MELGFKPFEKEEYRKRVGKMTDAQLLREGKILRALIEPKVVSASPATFAVQLEICREEWRQRNQKK